VSGGRVDGREEGELISPGDDGRPARQLVIGLDAMEWSLVRRWAHEGTLPTFWRLMAEAVRAELATTSAQLPDTVWACTYTGVNPAKTREVLQRAV
jgi:predicted AlkP superfamily phosphohydrolase/phosphomutase